jgi:hypothetical protein
MRSSVGQKLADAAALEHDGAARHLSGVRGKDGNDEHALEPVQRFFRADAHAAHLAERAGQRAALAAGLAAERSAMRRRLRWLVSARLMSSK